jgi:hypothetical protein
VAAQAGLEEPVQGRAVQAQAPVQEPAVLEPVLAVLAPIQA